MNSSANVLMRLVWIVCIDIWCLLLARAVAALAGVCGVDGVYLGSWWSVQYWSGA